MIQWRFAPLRYCIKLIIQYYTDLYYIYVEEGGNRHFSDALEGKALHVKSFSSLLKLLQFQNPIPHPMIIMVHNNREIFKKQNGSLRMASSDSDFAFMHS